MTSTVPRLGASDSEQYSNCSELLEATARGLHGAAEPSSSPTAADYRDAENHIFQQSQQDSFPDELRLLKTGKPVPSNSKLLTLSPEFDASDGLIRVGGRLRRAEALNQDRIHSTQLSSILATLPPDS